MDACSWGGWVFGWECKRGRVGVFGFGFGVWDGMGDDCMIER